MRPIFLIVLSACLFAADPFDTPDVKKSAEAYEAAKQTYVKALVAAWYDSGVHPVVVPALPSDPRQSEMDRQSIGSTLNEQIKNMNFNFKRWVTPEMINRENVVAGVMSDVGRTQKLLKDAEGVGLMALPKPPAEKPAVKEKSKIRAVLADGTVVEQ